MAEILNTKICSLVAIITKWINFPRNYFSNIFIICLRMVFMEPHKPPPAFGNTNCSICGKNLWKMSWDITKDEFLFTYISRMMAAFAFLIWIGDLLFQIYVSVHLKMYLLERYLCIFKPWFSFRIVMLNGTCLKVYCGRCCSG